MQEGFYVEDIVQSGTGGVSVEAVSTRVYRLTGTVLGEVQVTFTGYVQYSISQEPFTLIYTVTVVSLPVEAVSLNRNRGYASTAAGCIRPYVTACSHVNA